MLRRWYAAWAAAVTLVAVCAAAVDVWGGAAAVAATFSTSALDEPPAYVGLRVDRTWVAQDTVKSIGHPAAWSNVPIPDNVLLDRRIVAPWTRPLSDEVAAEIQAAARSDGSNTWINISGYSPPIYRVPVGQPLRPVRYCRTYVAATHSCEVPTWARALDQALRGVAADGSDLHGGVPVPDGVVEGAPGTDGEMVIVQPDWRPPDGWIGKRGQSVGRVWELWQFRLNPDFRSTLPESGANARFMASNGTRVAGLNHSRNHSADWLDPSTYYKADVPGDPNSERQELSWRVTGAGLHMISDVISDEDCALGSIRHAIGLELPATRGYARWPATATDGWNSALAVTEGMRLRFPRTLAMPSGLTAFGRMWFTAVEEYGLVIDDQTNSAVTTRVELNAPHCGTMFLGSSPAEQLRRMPFDKLQLLVAGSDAVPNPTG